MSTEAAADLHFYLVGALAAYPEATAQRILEGVDERAKAIEREAAAAAIERVRMAARIARYTRDGSLVVGIGRLNAILDAEAAK